MTDALTPEAPTHYDNPYLPIQEAVVAALRADPALSAKAPVYDFVPEDDQGPYVVFATAWLAETDKLRSQSDRVWFQIDVWSRYRGFAEVADIGSDVERILRHTELAVEGYNASGVHCLREQSHLLRDPGNVWRRLAMTFFCPFVQRVRST